ncbi:MAG: AAA family ATPase [Spirulina sp.]
MVFNIAEHIEFDAKGRAACPSCALEGKAKNKNLSLLETGAYKCFRGCTPKQIREAMGAGPVQTVPPPPTTTKAAKATVTPQKVKEATERLLNQSTHALRWLTDRGISSEMIEHYRLGVGRLKVTHEGKSGYVPSIIVPIPTADRTAYYQKKRTAPWVKGDERPDHWPTWSQYGIPQMVLTTHQPESPTQTWLCEGEWDAIMLGWAVRHSSLKNDVQVSCFTCGAGNVPPETELARLKGDVITWYDRDEAGAKGAHKVQARLTERCKVATVPAVDAPTGWDVSDAINAGLFEQFAAAVVEAAPWEPPKQDNPLRERLVSNDDMIARAADYTDWLVEDILTTDELFLLAASPRAGKSLLALTLTQAVATGGKFLGRPVAQGAVLYIRCEDSESKTKERQLKQGWGEGLPVYWLDRFKLSELNHLEHLVEELNISLVVFDTLSRVRDANISESSAEMSQLLEPLQEMCKRQRCCGILVHHTGKVSTDNAGTISVFDTIRGSSAIRATCRGVLILAADDRSYRLYVENGWGKLDLQVLLDAHTLQWRLIGNWVGPNVDLPQKDRVLNYLGQVGKATIDQISEATNLPKRSLYEVLKRLQADEMIEKHGSRQASIYVKSAIQQIQQLNSLLNCQDTDREIISASIQQLPESASPPEKVIIEPESDQKNDHFPDSTPTPHTQETVDKSAQNQAQQGLWDSTAIQHDSTTHSTGHSTGTIPPGFAVGCIVGKAGKFGWRGKLTGTFSTMALVHWHGDPKDSPVSWNELEVLEG